MNGVCLTVAYDGTNFAGWAAQRDQRTVEDTVRGAILAVDPKGSIPRGASRTDSGVHAEGQLAAFDASSEMPPRGWVLTLNRHLPDDVSIRAARVVPAGFNPRFASRKKRYSYTLLLDKVRDPLQAPRSWRIGWELDLDRLRHEATAIEGFHDFAAFRSAGDAREETRRTIHAVTVETLTDDPRLLRITVEGNAFLYNMVRILVGTLVDVARGNLKPGAITRALTSKDRGHAGQTAPAHGLVLRAMECDWPTNTGDSWPL